MGKDINIFMDKFACLLYLSCEGVDIHNIDLHDFEYPEGETALTASILLHGDENPALVRNEEVKYYTLTTEVLAKIVFYNLLPKSGEYSHARGSAPLLIYCLLKSIRINIPKLIVDFMLSEHLLIPNRHLPFGMLITRLLKQLKFDLSGERSIALSTDINNTLLKRMHVGEHAHVPHPSPFIPPVVPGSSSTSVDRFAVLSAQFQEHSLKMTTQLEKMSARQEEI